MCTKLKKKIDDDPELNQPSITSAEKNIEEHGVWQVLIGKKFAASVILTLNIQCIIILKIFPNTFWFLDLKEYGMFTYPEEISLR